MVQLETIKDPTDLLVSFNFSQKTPKSKCSSCVGCIGHIMAGSGLQEVLELVYAKKAIGHMLTGKAVARAVRGHFLVDAALNTLLVCITFNFPLPVDTRVYDAVQTTDEPTGKEERQEIPTLGILLF